MNNALVLLAALLPATSALLGGCFSPTFPHGVPCSAEGECPGDQICASDNRCYDDPGSSTSLVSLTLSAGALEPPFDPAVTQYTVPLGLRPADLGITATPLSTEVQLAIGETSAQPGVSSIIPLVVGEQTIKVTVTHTNGDSSTYAIVVNRGEAMDYRAFIKASNAEAGDRFGMGEGCFDSPCRTIAVSGDTLVVGAPGEAGGNGGVNVDESDNSKPEAGAVYVFVRNGDGSWAQQAYIKPIRTDPDDHFGTSVDLDGDTLVVGAPGEDSNETGTTGAGFNDAAESSGAAYVFVRLGTEWSQQAYLKASNTDAGDFYGFSVAVSGDTVAVGAGLEASAGSGINQGSESDNTAPGSGAAYVYTRSGASWTQQAYIKASNAEASDGFYQVFLDGEALAVGAFNEGSGSSGVNGDANNNDAPGSGAVYLFERNGVEWAETGYFKASNPAAGIGTFGGQVALDGERLVVGRPLETSAGSGIDGDQFDTALGEHVGSSYVFGRNQGVWEQEVYLKPSNSKSGASSAYFGHQLAVSRNLIAIGAPLEGSDGTGLNGDQNNQRASRSGAVYLFARQSGVWSQIGYAKAPNAESQDSAGVGLAISANGTLVFATGDDSSSTGIDGNEADNAAVDSGAVYVLE